MLAKIVLVAAGLGVVAATFGGGGGGGGCNATFPRVRTKNGVVEGFCISDSPLEVNAFLGIPFAKPPVGALRLEKTQPAENWSGVKSTKAHPPRCTQTTSDPQSEDCLYLNIFAPAPRDGLLGQLGNLLGLNKYPVVVMFYGGAFNTGGARGMGDITLAKNLVAKGVIVVVPQYRVGLLGWATTGDGTLGGNYGLWDATMSLRWVQDNIGAFGGDKNRVTLYGGSAGGTLADCLALSPHAWNLFHNIYEFSASSRDIFLLNITQRTLAKAAAVNITYTDNADLKTKLKAADAALFKAGWLVVTETSFPLLQNEWGPNEDGDFYPQATITLRALAPPKPRIMGVTIMEGAAFSAAITLTNNSIHQLMEYEVPTIIPNYTGIRNSLIQQYEALEAAVEPTAVVKAAFQAAFGDKMIVGPVIDNADKLLEVHGIRQPIYLYILEQFNPASMGASYPFVSQASHASDQYYLVGNGAWTYSADDITVMNYFNNFVANFAKTGNPNGPGVGTNWRRATRAQKDNHMRILPTPIFATSNYFGGRPRYINEIGKQAGYIFI